MACEWIGFIIVQELSPTLLRFGAVIEVYISLFVDILAVYCVFKM